MSPHLRRTAVVALVALALGTAGGARAQSFEGVAKDGDQRLEQSLAELASTRDRIAKEKIPLSKSISELEEQVLTLRQERARLQKLRDGFSTDLSTLRKEVEALSAQNEFVDGRLLEFVRDFEGRLDVSELAEFEALTAAAKLAEKSVNLDAEGKRLAQLAVVEKALERLRQQLGGRTYTGQALSPEGVLTDGTFVALGPTTFFASADGTIAGLVESQLNAADPVVVALPGVDTRGIAALAAGEAGRLPLDATLGKAVKIEKSRQTLWEHLEKGGVVGWVIVALGIAALLLAAFKCFEIIGFRVAPPEAIDDVLGDLAEGNREGAARRARQIEGISGEMLVTAVDHAGEKRTILEELLFEKILKVRPALERFLPFLAITAAAAPLLGLLGTVTGMIKTFQLLTIFGTGDAKSLSAGISEALVTTELGLIVAIPALVVHGALSRMAKHKLGLLEQLSMAVVNGLASIRHKEEKPLARVAEAV
jgi:biopolymer transport protein ExbB